MAALAQCLNNGVSLVSYERDENYWCLNDDNGELSDDLHGPFRTHAEAAEDACLKLGLPFDAEEQAEARRHAEAQLSDFVKPPNPHEYVTHIEQLMRQGEHREAEVLLKNICDEQEEYSRKTGMGVAPAYYWQLAVIYRKDGRIDDEVAILERYQRQIKAAGKGPEKLKDRLEKARKIQARQKG